MRFDCGLMTCIYKFSLIGLDKGDYGMIIYQSQKNIERKNKNEIYWFESVIITKY